MKDSSTTDEGIEEARCYTGNDKQDPSAALKQRESLSFWF